MFKHIGPGTLVAAAFIGPGTVTVCTIAGVRYGYDLLWAMVLSILATVVLQEMAARLGVVSQKGLSSVIRENVRQPILRYTLLALILSAIVIGNAAYEAGNVSGGVLGLQTITGDLNLSIGHFSLNLLSFLIGCLAFFILYIGQYKVIERVLISLVLLMSLTFLITAVLTLPNLPALFKGLLTPSIPKESTLTILALVGTTVVPYNLFLHAALVKERWKDRSDLAKVRMDTYVSILLGGLVSLAIIIVAASAPSSEINNAADLAIGLEPLLGSWAKYFLSLGLFAAGITSAITAPLAAAYVVKGCLGWNDNLKSLRFRSVWILILSLGILFSSLNIKAVTIITFAQIANGILLPVIAGILLWMMNKKAVLGIYTNNRLQNSIGILILAFSVFLGIKSLLKVAGYL